MHVHTKVYLRLVYYLSWGVCTVHKILLQALCLENALNLMITFWSAFTLGSMNAHFYISCLSMALNITAVPDTIHHIKIGTSSCPMTKKIFNTIASFCHFEFNKHAVKQTLEGQPLSIHKISQILTN